MENKIKNFLKIEWYSEGSILARRGRLTINTDEVILSADNDYQATIFFLALLKYWGKVTAEIYLKGREDDKFNEVSIFCDDYIISYQDMDHLEISPYNQWEFEYKTPSNCKGCVSAQKIIEKVFGSCERFNELPFVQFLGDRRYRFNLGDIKKFITEALHKSSE